MNKDLIAIFEYLEHEKGIKREIVVEAIKESLEVAARKSIHGAENVEVIINSKTGSIDVYCDKIVVEKATNPSTQISLKEAQQFDQKASLGEVYHVVATPKDFGRIAAQNHFAGAAVKRHGQIGQAQVLFFNIVFNRHCCLGIQIGCIGLCRLGDFFFILAKKFFAGVFDKTEQTHVLLLI